MTSTAVIRTSTSVHAALTTVHQADPTSLPPDYAAYLDHPANQWSAKVATVLYAWCLGDGLHRLLGAGIDPDMIPPPPTRSISMTGNDTITVTNSDPDPDVDAELSGLPEYVPGARLSTLHPRPEHLNALRALVTRHGFAISSPSVAFLRTLAETATLAPQQAAPAAAAPTPPTPQIVSGPDGSWLLRNVNHGDLAAAANTISGARWDHTVDAFTVPASSVAEVRTFAAAHNIVLPAALNTPLNFDGTVDGLRGVPLSELKSVPASRIKNFNKFGVYNAYDVLFTMPRRYLDRSQIVPVNNLAEGDDTCVVGTVATIRVDQRRRMARIGVKDATGTITATYFNAAWQAKRFKVGDRVIMYGRPEKYARTNSWSMVNPLLDPFDDQAAPVIPIYPQSGKSGVTTWDVRRAADEVISRITGLTDPLPADIIAEHHLIDRWTALRHMHFPDSITAAEQARHRIAFDELFRMQTALLLAKNADAAETGVVHRPSGALTAPFIARLPYPLTGAQQRATEEIGADLARPHPMHRLLQGDVGSGKTVMALYTLLGAVESGYQGALMAPTEILARQLYTETLARTEGLTKPDGAPLVVEYFTNRLRGKKKTETLARLADGTIDIAVGTHALITDDIVFANLGLVVIDEQHRFGVEQRASLRDKGPDGAKPDMLIMTATPIPRTSAMTVFGDLDVTVLDELPPGRTPIETTWFDIEPQLHNSHADPWEFVRQQVGEGRQAFIVCPLVEESEKMQVVSATETFEALEYGALSGLRLGLVHGQQKPDERDDIMNAFRLGDLDVIVATTVIEVGVNVPNATVMVVLDSVRFGLSQLHQLRGRVGRGAHKSYCYLVGRGKSPDSRTRMEALVESTDGFYLAEVDLTLRSFGTIYGKMQHGQGDMIVADLSEDRELLFQARDAVLKMLEDDPKLDRRPALRHEVRAALNPDAEEWLSRS